MGGGGGWGCGIKVVGGRDLGVSETLIFNCVVAGGWCVLGVGMVMGGVSLWLLCFPYIDARICGYFF